MSENHRLVRIWDLPTRLFHWVLAACVVGSAITAQVAGNAMVWHFRLGYVVFALLAFRLIWGWVGGRWSRFGSFVRGPGTVLRYLRGAKNPGDRLDVGHNPLGGLSVLGLIGILSLQVGTGLFADDEIASAGPLINLVSGATSWLLTTWHKTFGPWLILLLVGLHLVAILYCLIRKRQNLVGAMVSGDKMLPMQTMASADGWKPRLLAAALLGLCAASVAWVLQLGAMATGR